MMCWTPWARAILMMVWAVRSSSVGDVNDGERLRKRARQVVRAVVRVSVSV